MHVGKKTLSALMALTLTASLAACSASDRERGFRDDPSPYG